MQPSAEERRTSMWAYYDRRIAHREPGPRAVLNYFRGLGVDADLGVINSELREIEQRLTRLPATTFVDVGAGPSGTFTLQVPGPGIALDQSDGALRQLHTVAPGIPVARGDALHLPLRTKAVGRVFASHLYGLLLPDERAAPSLQKRRASATRSSFSTPVAQLAPGQTNGRRERFRTGLPTRSTDGTLMSRHCSTKLVVTHSSMGSTS